MNINDLKNLVGRKGTRKPQIAYFSKPLMDENAYTIAKAFVVLELPNWVVPEFPSFASEFVTLKSNKHIISGYFILNSKVIHYVVMLAYLEVGIEVEAVSIKDIDSIPQVQQ